MKTTLDLPDDLVKEIKLLAVHEGKKLKEAVEALLRKGLAAGPGRTKTKVAAEPAMLKRRKELTRKFVSGEWGVELAGYEQAQAADRISEVAREKAWRK